MKHTIASLTELFSPLAVMVVGDMRLDMDVQVDFTRISSREQTGIPVGLSSGSTSLVWGAGGAANLAMNLARMGVKVYVIGTWGDEYDCYRYALEYILRSEPKILTSFLTKVRQTYVYGRYTVGGHLRDRYDINIDPLLDEDKANLIGSIKMRFSLGMYPSVNGIILSDYTEGDEQGGVVIPEVVELVKKQGIPTFGSSRDHIEVLAGVDHVVMNEPEWRIQRKKGIVAGKLSSVMTKESSGVEVYTDNLTDYIPTRPVEGDINPCGAGDTFLAAYTASVIAGMDYEEACKVGMAAARHTVKQMVGTGYPTVEDIVNEYAEIYGGK